MDSHHRGLALPWIVPVVVALVVGIGCEGDDPVRAPGPDPEPGDAACRIFVVGPDSAAAGVPTSYAVWWESDRSFTSLLHWSVLDSLGRAVDAVTPSDTTRSAVVDFPDAGRYRVVVIAEDVGSSSCGVDTSSVDVVVLEGGSGIDPDCWVEVDVPPSIVNSEGADFRVDLGPAWSDAVDVAWEFDGPGGAFVLWDSRAEGTIVARLGFSVAGSYVVRAIVTDPGATSCGRVVETLAVDVGLGDCSVWVNGRRDVFVGEEALYQVVTGNGWTFGPDTAQPEWRLVAGPDGGAVFGEVRDAYAHVEFVRPGRYGLEVRLEDRAPGLGCPTFVDTVFVDVVGDPDAPIPLGTIALGSPATGPANMLARSRQVLAFGTYTVAFVPTEAGTEAIDLLRGARVDSLSRLDAAPAIAPQWSMLLGQGVRANPFTLYEIDGTRTVLTDWDAPTATWSSPSRVDTRLEDAVDFHQSPLELWPYPARRGPPPSLCFDGFMGIFVSANGLVYQLDWVSCPDDSWQSRDLRFDPSLLSEPDGPVESAALAGDGGLLVLLGGGTGRLLHTTGVRASIDVFDAGPVGSSPRRIRAVNRVVAMTNFTTDSITVFRWNGRETPITPVTVPVGDRPMELDVRAREGGGAIVLTTSPLDGSVAITEVAADGTVVQNDVEALPAGWSGGVYAMWVHDADRTYLVTRIGNDEVLVRRAP